MTKKGSFLNVSIIPKSLIPECLYQESKLFKSKKHGFPSPRHPGNLQAGVHKYLKTKEKPKAWIPD
jgi:hypothetical protein